MDVTKRLKIGVGAILAGVVATVVVLLMAGWPDPHYHKMDCFIQEIIETLLNDTITLRIDYNYTDNKGEIVDGAHYKDCAYGDDNTAKRCVENTYEKFPVDECVKCFYNDARLTFKQPRIGITFFIVFGPMFILVGVVFLVDYCRERHSRPSVYYLLDDYTNL